MTGCVRYLPLELEGEPCEVDDVTRSLRCMTRGRGVSVRYNLPVMWSQSSVLVQSILLVPYLLSSVLCPVTSPMVSLVLPQTEVALCDNQLPFYLSHVVSPEPVSGTDRPAV